MSAVALMVQGTASHVGKSTLAAGLCRILRQQGCRVAPFKSQNMSNNAAATASGEIGRAQAVQAAACGLEPTVDMNPVLLKPTGPNACQWVVQGRPRGVHGSREHGRYPPEVLAAIRESYARLAATVDVMVLEGAGSPAEINLLDRDFANMWMAEVADARVLLVGDIERGGVFAALYGTWSLAPRRERIRAFALNKFRGDAGRLDSGMRRLQALTGVPTLGVVPYCDLRLPEEDSLGVPAAAPPAPRAAALRIGVIRLPQIANFTDFDPLAQRPGVELTFIAEAAELDGCDVIVLPGTKSTIADLQSLRARGFEPALRAAHVQGKPILGVCGGYQMLGRRIRDPGGVESPVPEMEGLRLLPVETRFDPEKRVGRVRGRACAGGHDVTGYFIQHGRVERQGGEPMLRLGDDGGELEGCAVGRVWGVSVHGLFDEPGFCDFALAQWRTWADKLPAAETDAPATLDQRLDRWADFLRRHLDLEALFDCLGVRGANA